MFEEVRSSLLFFWGVFSGLCSVSGVVMQLLLLGVLLLLTCTCIMFFRCGSAVGCVAALAAVFFEWFVVTCWVCWGHSYEAELFWWLYLDFIVIALAVFWSGSVVVVFAEYFKFGCYAYMQHLCIYFSPSLCVLLRVSVSIIFAVIKKKVM